MVPHGQNSNHGDTPQSSPLWTIFFVSVITEHVSSFRAPANAADWRMMFPGEPDRAAAHEAIDGVYRNAQRVFRAQIKAGIGA